jgi:glyoxylase-like metal-dependent hydrolase (beta-lactamase superfamily II)
LHHWQGDFLGGLARVGVRPEDVDVVVNTHVHGDHVGWNTVGVDGGWEPTFPTEFFRLLSPLSQRESGASKAAVDQVGAELSVTQTPAEGALEVLVVGEGGVGQRATP